MPRTLEMAIHAAISKRGVAVVVIPGDVALQPALEARLPKAPGLLPAEPAAAPAKADLDRLAALLNSDARVTMLCGSGCQDAHAQLLSLAERLKAPIVHALKGKEHIEWGNPYDVGMTGLIGFSSGYYAMHDCDVLLMLGTPITNFRDQSGSDDRANAGELLELPTFFTGAVPSMEAFLDGADRCRDCCVLARKNIETEPCSGGNTIAILAAPCLLRNAFLDGCVG